MATKLVIAGDTSPFLPENTGSQFTSRGLTYLCIFTADVLAVAILLGTVVFAKHLVTPTYHLTSYINFFPCLALLPVAFWLNGLYPGLLLHPSDEIKRIVISVSTIFLILGSTSYLWRASDTYSRSVFLMGWLAGAPIILMSRHLTRRALLRLAWFGVPVVVLGSGPTARRTIRALTGGRTGFKVTGVLYETHVQSWTDDLPPLLGHISLAPGIASSGLAQYAIVAMPEKTKVELGHAIQDYCRGFRHVLIIPDLPGLCSLGISTREIGGEVGLELPQKLFHRGAATLKRTLDLAIGTMLLLALSPIFLIVAAAIKLNSKGPVFFTHTRHGKNGTSFSALKFRTMKPDGVRLLAEHLQNDSAALEEWRRDQKLKSDPRITKVGKWLRRSSVDELPQLINVLAGQMSLVGPRPIIREEIARYSRGYGLYTRVRPGITGLWQVSGRNNTTYEERVAFDEYYVRNWSIWLDGYILIRTVKVVVTGHGAY